MGISGLYPFLKKKAPKGISKTPIIQFENQVFGIDGNAMLYKYVYVVGEDVSQLEAKTLEFARFLKSHKITPVFVFDGAPPATKIVLVERRKRRRNAEDACENISKRLKTIQDEIIQPQETPAGKISELSEAEQIAQDNLKLKCIQLQNQYDIKKKQTFKISRQQTNRIQEMLHTEGFLAYTADGEADHLLTAFARSKFVDGILADDGDILAGMPDHSKLLRNLKAHEESYVLEVYCKRTILRELEMSHSQFIDMCVLFGCDYLPRIPKVGPITGFNGLKKNGSVEVFVKSLSEKLKAGIPGLTNEIETVEDYLQQFANSKREFFLETYDETRYPELVREAPTGTIESHFQTSLDPPGEFPDFQ